MSWRNLCPHGLEGRVSHRSAPPEDNEQDISEENGNLPNQGGRHRIRRGPVSSHAALSSQNDANVNMASAASVGAAPTDGNDQLMVPLYSGEIITGGMFSALGIGETTVPAGVGASGDVDPPQGDDSNVRGNTNRHRHRNRSRTPIRSGSRSLGGRSASNESSSDESQSQPDSHSEWKP